MIETARLILRPWRDADRAPFAAINADAEVMRYFPAPYSRVESDLIVDYQGALFAAKRWGFLAVERKADGVFLGHIGVKPTHADLPFDQAPEVGWRLGRHAWGQGYATEGARAVLAYGFETLRFDTIFSFTTVHNAPSEAVMKRLGMFRAADRDFDHPHVAEETGLRRHIVYIARAADPLRPV